MIEFTEWPKIGRMNRMMTITEKIDGTNAAVGIIDASGNNDPIPGYVVNVFEPELSIDALVYAQSRSRIISPRDDNFGFAEWVWENAAILAATLGAGVHFGEWWGQGIQRRYGLTEKRFSLFNTKRWNEEIVSAVPQLHVVPVLYEGQFDSQAVNAQVEFLKIAGSTAAPGFMKPEGVVVYHHGLGEYMKVTVEKDEQPKSEQK